MTQRNSPERAAVADPVVRDLVSRIPIVGWGNKAKPRKFRRYCECFEWVFTQVQHDARRLNNFFADRDHLVETVDSRAKALWRHLHPAAHASTDPKWAAQLVERAVRESAA